MSEQAQIRVWDPLVRFFHWSLASAFLIAFITEDDFMTVHSWAGYLILSLLLVRLVWGFIGTRHARFSDFVYRPVTIKAFLKDTLRLRAKRYIGHNPAGGAMVIMLMLSLLVTATSGMLLFGAAEQSGPLAQWFVQSGAAWADPLEEVHEFFANFTMLLVVIHVAGVIVESLIHRENLVSAMISGFKQAQPASDSVNVIEGEKQ
jgi:cytochrome b